MKLVTKINLNFISAASFVLFAGCVLFYVLLRNITINNIDQELLRYQSATKQEFGQLLHHPERFIYFDVLLHIEHSPTAKNERFSDTTLVVKGENGHFRNLSFSHAYKGHNYEVAIFKSLRQADELTVQLLFALCSLIVFFMLSFYFLNRYVAIRSLEDFFSIINKLRNIQVDKKENIALPQTDVDEFEELNQALYQITDRIRQDFFNLKEFTENASHEIQTPLAVMSTQLEQMFQDTQLSEPQLLNLVTLQEAVNRLSKLNKGLLLLAKIENQQFEATENVPVREILQKQLDNLEEFIDDKQIQLQTELNTQVQLKLNPYLTELLFFNLLKNAIRHNKTNGYLIVKLTNTQLTITNDGLPEALDTDRIFERFAKGGHSKSMGLGLAIVKKICDLYQIDIRYSFANAQHSMHLKFATK